MRFKQRNKELKLTIESLSRRGLGQGVFTNSNEHSFCVEVPYTLKNETVTARVVGKKRKCLIGELQEIHTPSPDRTQAPCIHFGVCGGCQWQHMAYDAQLREKESRVKALFPESDVNPILGAPSPFAYRNKMEFTFSQNKKGERFLGLIQQGSKGYVENLNTCLLAAPWMSTLLTAVKEWWENEGLTAYYPPKNEGTLRNLILRHGIRTDEKMVVLSVSGKEEDALSADQLQRFQERIQKELGDTVSLFLHVVQVLKGQPTQVYELLLGGKDHITEELVIENKCLTFKISPHAFFQPNTLQAERLYTRALEMAELKGTETVYDLYAGTGTLGLLASLKAKEVVSVEIVPDAVYDARANARANGQDNITCLKGDVAEVVNELVEKGDTSSDVVFVDPPRSGLGPKAISQVLRLHPKRVIYISCQPITQAEDIAQFEGYKIHSIQPVDQFPQTPHIENIIRLDKV